MLRQVNSGLERSSRRAPPPSTRNPRLYTSKLRETVNRALREDIFIPCRTLEAATAVISAIKDYKQSCTEWRHPKATEINGLLFATHPTSDLISLDDKILLSPEHYPVTLVLTPDPCFNAKLFAGVVGRSEYKRPYAGAPISASVRQVLHQTQKEPSQ